MKHLKNSNKTYFEHMFEAIQGSIILIIVALVSFVHAIFPFMFPKYVSSVLIKIYYRHFHYHPSPDVQEIVKSEQELASRKREIIGDTQNVINFTKR